jgi:membrane protein involved in colicin uptake
VRVHEESGAARAADERARTEREAASANEDAKQRATAEANRRANDK